MKSLIKYSIIAIFALFIFTGCGCTEPEIRIFKEKEVVLVEPDPINYTYVDTPSFPEDAENMDVDEALDVTTIYAIKMQSVVLEYEARVDSLKKFIEDSKAKIKEIKETNK